MTGGVFTKFDVTCFTPSVKRFAFDSSLTEGAEILGKFHIYCRTGARFYEIFIFLTTLKKVLTFRLVNANILPSKSQENRQMGKFSFAVEYFYFYFINFFGKVIMSFAAKQVA